MVGNTGVLEVGPYIDFHVASNNGVDADYRLTASPGILTCSGGVAVGGTLTTQNLIVNGATPTITGITKSHVGLGSVDNVADIDKGISTLQAAALALKSNIYTTIAGYGITDAYTKTQIDTTLAGKTNNATTIAGYGITDCYNKTQVDIVSTKTEC